MEWEVVLNGDPRDLASLISSTDSEPLVEQREDGEFVLPPHHFCELVDSRKVRAKAQELAQWLNGAIRAQWGRHAGIGIGAITRRRPDGGGDLFIGASALIVESYLPPVTVILEGRDGEKVVIEPSQMIKKVLECANNCSTMARVLRYRDKPNLSWVDLVRVIEAVQNDLGAGGISGQGWASKREINRIKQTANSLQASGDESRHGVERGDPPANPLAIEEAQLIVDRIINRWFDFKVSKDDGAI